MVLDSGHGGNLLAKARELGSTTGQLVDFSANINPLGPPPAVYTALSENLTRIVHYPYSQGAELIPKLAARFGVAEQNLLVGNGAGELIYLLLHQLQPNRVVVTNPTFSEYTRAAAAAGAEIREVLLEASSGFQLEPEKAGVILSQLPRNSLLFICNPNNPTGHLWSTDLLALLAREAKNNGFYLCLDESFLPFVQSSAACSLMREVNNNDNLIVIQSLTKFYALPGLRLGFMVAAKTLVRLCEAARDPWTVNTLAQLAGTVCLEGEEYSQTTWETIAKERSYLSAALHKLPQIRLFPSEANFLLCEITGSSLSASEAASNLEKSGILIRDCSNFPGLGSNFFRIAVRTRLENDRLLEALKQLFSGDRGDPRLQR